MKPTARGRHSGPTPNHVIPPSPLPGSYAKPPVGCCRLGCRCGQRRRSHVGWEAAGPLAPARHVDLSPHMIPPTGAPPSETLAFRQSTRTARSGGWPRLRYETTSGRYPRAVVTVAAGDRLFGRLASVAGRGGACRRRTGRGSIPSNWPASSTWPDAWPASPVPGRGESAAPIGGRRRAVAVVGWVSRARAGLTFVQPRFASPTSCRPVPMGIGQRHTGVNNMPVDRDPQGYTQGVPNRLLPATCRGE